MNDPGNRRTLGFSAGAANAGARSDAAALIEAIRSLRAAPRNGEFWQAYSRCVAQLCRASATAIAARTGDETWTLLAQYPHADDEDDADSAQASLQAQRWMLLLADVRERLGDKGFGIAPPAPGASAIGVGVRLIYAQADVILLLQIPDVERARLNELVLRAQLVADLAAGEAAGSDQAADATMAERQSGARADASDTPGAVVRFGQRAGVQTSSDALLDWLELVARVMQYRQFGPAALALVNGVAARTGWTQVVLGWQQGSYVRSQAISHLERFERRAEHVRLLEAAMEETLDQDALLQYPAPVARAAVSASGDPDAAADAALDEVLASQPVIISHTRLAQGLGFARIASVPLRETEDAASAVLLLASEEADAPELQLEAMRLSIQMLMPWLAELQLRSRWFGARWVHRAGRFAEDTLSLRNPWKKLAAVLSSAALLYIVFGTWPHRLDATAELVTDSAQILNAPFEAYVEQVQATVGDTVRQGDLLALLDRQELLLQESELRAEIRKLGAEAEKARAASQTADVQIALARRAQAQVRLERVLHNLEQSRIVAPFDGVVVEGERKELLGAPVRRGDKMFRVARIEGIYVTLFVPEADMRYLPADARGEVSLLSQPEHSYPIIIEAVIPVAQVKPQQGNLFMIRARFVDDPQSWWRPGMTGVARIDAGDRNILWLMTRRAVDAIRLKLWW
ncbi:MAG: hypothetical protein RI906_621 [Pseudomonadota bacterium]|jgi:hypothetical protein